MIVKYNAFAIGDMDVVQHDAYVFPTYKNGVFYLQSCSLKVGAFTIPTLGKYIQTEDKLDFLSFHCGAYDDNETSEFFDVLRSIDDKIKKLFDLKYIPLVTEKSNTKLRFRKDYLTKEFLTDVVGKLQGGECVLDIKRIDDLHGYCQDAKIRCLLKFSIWKNDTMFGCRATMIKLEIDQQLVDFVE